MSCKKGKNNNQDNCVCDVLQAILDAQNDANGNGNGCTSGCAQFLVNQTMNPTVDTIPFILITKKNTLQYAFTNIAVGTGPDSCDVTIYFRINALDDCCATLELLDHNNENLGSGGECCIRIQDVCPTGDLMLERTGQCITVDLDCICAVQCFDPTVVMNNGAAALRRRANLQNQE